LNQLLLIINQKLSVCMSVNQGGTNHNRYAYRLVIPACMYRPDDELRYHKPSLLRLEVILLIYMYLCRQLSATAVYYYYKMLL